MKLIKEAGSKGILQSELRHILGIDSRDGSRLVLKLVRKGIIRRKEEMYKGRKTYRIFYVAPRRSMGELKVKMGISLDIECFTCPVLTHCNVDSYYNPQSCPFINGQINRLVEAIKRRRGGNGSGAR